MIPRMNVCNWIEGWRPSHDCGTGHGYVGQERDWISQLGIHRGTCDLSTTGPEILIRAGTVMPETGVAVPLPVPPATTSGAPAGPEDNDAISV